VQGEEHYEHFLSEKTLEEKVVKYVVAQRGLGINDDIAYRLQI